MYKNSVYTNICFEGGGVLGFSYIGTILMLEKYGITKNLKRYAGSSVGALFASLLCIGFTGNEILDISKKLNLKNQPMCLIKKVYNIWKHMGIYPLSNIENQIKKYISDKVNPDITLKELFDKTGKDLVIISTNLNRKTSIYFHYKTFPDVKLSDAILLSMSIPVIFQPRKMNYIGTDDYYIDGGASDNYIIWVFNDLKKLSEGKIPEIDKHSSIPYNTLGIKILENCETNTKNVLSKRLDIKNVSTFLSEILSTLMLQIERSNITPTYIKQTIPIYTSNISSTDFNIDNDTINVLINNGIKYTELYFDPI